MASSSNGTSTLSVHDCNSMITSPLNPYLYKTKYSQTAFSYHQLISLVVCVYFYWDIDADLKCLVLKSCLSSVFNQSSTPSVCPGSIPEECRQCHAQADCVPGVGCQCKSGFQGNGTSCSPEPRECSALQHNLSAGVTESLLPAYICLHVDSDSF